MFLLNAYYKRSLSTPTPNAYRPRTWIFVIQLLSASSVLQAQLLSAKQTKPSPLINSQASSISNLDLPLPQSVDRKSFSSSYDYSIRSSGLRKRNLKNKDKSKSKSSKSSKEYDSLTSNLKSQSKSSKTSKDYDSLTSNLKYKEDKSQSKSSKTIKEYDSLTTKKSKTKSSKRSKDYGAESARQPKEKSIKGSKGDKQSNKKSKTKTSKDNNSYYEKDQESSDDSEDKESSDDSGNKTSSDDSIDTENTSDSGNKENSDDSGDYYYVDYYYGDDDSGDIKNKVAVFDGCILEAKLGHPYDSQNIPSSMMGHHTDMLEVQRGEDEDNFCNADTTQSWCAYSNSDPNGNKAYMGTNKNGDHVLHKETFVLTDMQSITSHYTAYHVYEYYNSYYFYGVTPEIEDHMMAAELTITNISKNVTVGSGWSHPVDATISTHIKTKGDGSEEYYSVVNPAYEGNFGISVTCTSGCDCEAHDFVTYENE